MIKVLFFIETIEGGGAEKVLRNLVNNMDQTRFDITVQTVWPCDPSQYFVPGIHYKSMYPIQNRLNILGYRIESAMGLAYTLHLKDDYDIECAYLECGTTKILAGSTNKKAIKLAWVHCDMKKLMPNPEQFVKHTIKYYKKFDRVVCVSEQGKKSFEELFGECVKTEIVYNTVDCEEIVRKSKEGITKDLGLKYPLVVSLGRLSKPKHYIRLLRSHKRLMDEGIEHMLLILGEGPDRKELEEYIEENKLQDTVCLLGFMNNPYPYVKMADLLVCSSIYECFSTFITEGLVLGKPIVTTDVSGMRELLGDSKYGLITENEDMALYDGMKQMLTNPKLRLKYAEQAIIRGQDFSTKSLVKETEQFLLKCINSRR